MKPSDGMGERSDTFEKSSQTDYETMSTRDRWRAFLVLWVVAPARIMWNDRRTRTGGLIIVFFLLMATVGVTFYEAPSHNQGPNVMAAFQSWEFPLGTDGLGQDALGVTIHATPAMLQMAFAGGLFATVVGTTVGTLAGYKRGLTERVLLTAADIAMTIPGLPLLIVLAIALEPRDPWLVGVLLAANAWAGLSRALHSQVLALRSEPYVEASRILGLGSPEIIRDDILPNIMPYILINLMNNMVGIINASVGLYFLGVLPYTTLNWGVMINNAFYGGALHGWGSVHWIILPIFAISLLGFGLTLFAQGMDQIFNPRVRARHASTTNDPGDHLE